MEKRKLKNNIDIQSWKNFQILQQPNWPCEQEYQKIIKKLKTAPSLILYHEIIELKQRLKKINSKRILFIV